MDTDHVRVMCSFIVVASSSSTNKTLRRALARAAHQHHRNYEFYPDSSLLLTLTSSVQFFHLTKETTANNRLLAPYTGVFLCLFEQCLLPVLLLL